jgi:hypothetical protein
VSASVHLPAPLPNCSGTYDCVSYAAKSAFCVKRLRVFGVVCCVSGGQCSGPEGPGAYLPLSSLRSLLQQITNQRGCSCLFIATLDPIRACVDKDH